MKYISFISIILVFACQHKQENTEQQHHFSFTIETQLPGEPEVVYDNLTGDISPWWDHTFSGHPHQLFIEAKPGGGFYEIFDESGDGVRHAVVTGAQKGKLLRMEGPLGLAGHALTLVTTYHLSEVNDSTHLKVEVHGAGEYKKDWPQVIENVWTHFIIERFKPYWEEKYTAGLTQ
ncbi:hypothetical protein J1N10_10030 [Carboxylicivirga sp. A043]|uniref:hypothetical protein n=1 Tax=Carboxylicivirga litoralis TaxID=2816963 RepID=UPI0021CB7007|nr:hypothetical protein [Carboxylicivirga sp. A043]MCU4156317.1 hypothetical protein [Carboxylicivirga sp. A043]